MKTTTVFICVVLLFLSCKREDYICSHTVKYYPPSFVFVGFSEDEIKQTLVFTYKANSNFEEWVRTDSLSHSLVAFKGDTAFSVIDTTSGSLSGFKSIWEGYDYKIQCLQNGKTFSITNIRSGPDVYTWTQKEHCSPGASQTQFTSLAFDVDGLPGHLYSWLIFALPK